nr:uncharacterized protein LOC109179565 isoform X1 [Ipomoea batatas]
MPKTSLLLKSLWWFQLVVALQFSSSVIAIRKDVSLQDNYICRTTVQGRYMIADDKGCVSFLNLWTIFAILCMKEIFSRIRESPDVTHVKSVMLCQLIHSLAAVVAKENSSLANTKGTSTKGEDCKAYNSCYYGLALTNDVQERIQVFLSFVQADVVIIQRVW